LSAELVRDVRLLSIANRSTLTPRCESNAIRRASGDQLGRASSGPPVSVWSLLPSGGIKWSRFVPPAAGASKAMPDLPRRRTSVVNV
jgi:hypothetical protein